MKPNNVVFDAFCDWNDLYSVVATSGKQQTTRVEVNDGVRVSLVDFGLSERYIAEDVEDIDLLNGGYATHIKFEKINRTLGNKFFMSLNQLKKYGKFNPALIS